MNATILEFNDGRVALCALKDDEEHDFAIELHVRREDAYEVEILYLGRDELEAVRDALNEMVPPTKKRRSTP